MNNLARNKVRELLLAEPLLWCGLLVGFDRADPGREGEARLGQVGQLQGGGDKVALQPLDIVPVLPDVGLPQVLRVPVAGEVEVLVLVEHQTNPARLVPVGSLEGSGGVELVLGHFYQDGAVGERKGQATHTRVSESFQTLTLI